METELSVIIPMKNLGESIKEVLKTVNNCVQGINVEYILLALIAGIILLFPYFITYYKPQIKFINLTIGAFAFFIEFRRRL